VSLAAKPRESNVLASRLCPGLTGWENGTARPRRRAQPPAAESAGCGTTDWHREPARTAPRTDRKSAGRKDAGSGRLSVATGAGSGDTGNELFAPGGKLMGTGRPTDHSGSASAESGRLAGHAGSVADHVGRPMKLSGTASDDAGSSTDRAGTASAESGRPTEHSGTTIAEREGL
jgi:hypothetical protein